MPRCNLAVREHGAARAWQHMCGAGGAPQPAGWGTWAAPRHRLVRSTLKRRLEWKSYNGRGELYGVCVCGKPCQFSSGKYMSTESRCSL